MSTTQTEMTDDSAEVAALVDAERRQILAHLVDRSSPVSESELGTQLVAEQQGKPLFEVAPEAVERARIRLAHTHLPRLDRVGLVEWDRDAATVETSDHPVVRDGRFQRLLGVEADDWDEVVRAIADGERRRVLAVLADADGYIEQTTLARRTVARIHDVSATEVPEREQRELLVRLHHVHLPKLRRAGLVACDEERTCYEGHPELGPELLEFDPDSLDARSAVAADDSAAGTTGERPTAADIQTIDGREDIIARGQSLFDEADDELFLMITTDGLLEPGCLDKLSDAADRGVDIYVGSQSADVRDLVRRQLPEAVIWEPQRDWLSLPPERERVGRLVLADREAVLLGTLGERVDGVHRETALTGTGADNGLVILLREMLGRRLDHLDTQSEDFLRQLPL